MNPFVNPNNRSISLPQGCKDLIDVLQGPSPPDIGREEAIRRLIRAILFEAQKEGARELFIGPASSKGIPIRYKVEGTWYEMHPFPSRIRPAVVAELGSMAGFPEGPFPKEGLLSEVSESVLLQWRIRITEAEGDCEFTRASR
jgi:hypothetical protein